MKVVQLTIKDENLMVRKDNSIQKRISVNYWMGWGGGYTRPKKKS